MTPEYAFLLGGAACACSYPVGARLAARRGGHVVLLLATLLLILQVLVSWNPHWVFHERLAGLWAVFQSSFTFAPALVILGFGRRLLGTRRERRSLSFLALALMAIVLWRTSWMIVPPSGGADVGANAQHFLAQTTPESCGPASSVSLLAIHGIETTEKEMVRLIRPLPHTGASFWQIYRGIEERTRGTGWRPRLVKADANTLLRDHRAAIVSLLRGHAVTVHRTSENLTLLDPGTDGPRDLPHDIWREHLGRTAIVLVPVNSVDHAMAVAGDGRSATQRR